MSEVSAWNATDNANTAAPPDGWPEGQQPSSVNDCGRMMMGALRREHDRISAQIGSVVGTINTTTINATTISTTGAITASGPITGTALNSTGNSSIAGTLTAGAVGAGTLTVSGLATAANLNVSGTVTAGQLTSIGNIDAAGDLTAVNIHANSGSLTAGALGILGNSSLGGTTYTHNVLAYSDNAASVGLLGAAYSGMSAYGFTTVSDQSVKGDIQPLPPGSLDLVQTIPPHTYVMLTGPDQETRHAGFIAQEVEQALQAAGHVGGYVLDKDSGVAGLNYNELVCVLWGAVQELTKQVEALREKIDV